MISLGAIAENRKFKVSMLFLALLLALLMAVYFIFSHSDQELGINGRLVEYYTVNEYVAPLAAVVDSDGETHIIAIMADIVTENGIQNDVLRSKLLDRSLTGCYVRVINGEKGKTILLGDKKVLVYQAYQIEIITDADN